MSEDIRRVKQEKQALEADLQLMKKERDLAKARATSASGKTGRTASVRPSIKGFEGAPTSRKRRTSLCAV